jgi:hypothetical protein
LSEKAALGAFEAGALDYFFDELLCYRVSNRFEAWRNTVSVRRIFRKQNGDIHPGEAEK